MAPRSNLKQCIRLLTSRLQSTSEFIALNLVMKDEVLRTRHSLSIFVPMLPSTVTCIAFSSSCYAAKKCVPSNRRQKKSSVYMQEKKKDVSSRFWLAVSVVTSNTRDVFTKFQNTEIYITQRRELKINTTPRRILSTNFGVFQLPGDVIKNCLVSVSVWYIF